ncbi:hypothetical protein CWR48_04935 [Oceanobacillus arenosus]|uniref:Uncharacterized protein n=1 Tax=Oceanobacillus arenosus TaxID=1229153 RepID=A0A3D8PWC8_9BACI|nr:hypothetical protein [Oceanobacillus arenosus]RDW20072.1 hypothetical protein CWR48_04935 [Oceanobacillus arenosus]
MADYKYLGLTTYILENEENEEKLNVLAGAIESLQTHVTPMITGDFVIEKYQNVVGSEAYQFVYETDYVCTPADSELPVNTPEKYKRPSIEAVTIKGIPMLNVYIPAVAKRQENIENFIYGGVRPVLQVLFGNNIVQMVMKEGIEYEDFQNGKETVLISVKERLAVPD